MIKRRFLIAILAVALTCTMAFTSIASSIPEKSTKVASTPLKYDINGDNSEDLVDVVLLAQYVAGWEDLVYDETKLDTDEDEVANLNDVVYLAQYLAGWDMTPDYSKNLAKYNWPNISPNYPEAGSPYVPGGEESAPAGSISRMLLTTDKNQGLPFSVECYLEGTTFTALLPAGTYINALVPTFIYNSADKIYYDGELVTSTTAFDFRKPVELSLVSASGTKKYTLYVMTLNTGLPSVSIQTADGTAIESKVEYEACTIFAGGGDYLQNGQYAFDKNEVLSATATIKGRGWTSWYYYPKKSYSLKFDKKQGMLGLPAHKEWVLAANFADRSLIRNAVAMELAADVGMETIMDVRFIDLWENGVYAGNYQLIEKIEVDEERVDITKFKDADSPEGTGYIIETNGHNRAEGEFGIWTNGQDADRPSLWQQLNSYTTYDPISGDIFFTSKHFGSIFNINKPSDGNLMDLDEATRQKYIEYIYNYMDKMEAAIKAQNYNLASQYLDMEAMAKWYIVEELAMNTDSKLHCSCYMYKDANGKMKMGPVWDFDLGFGNGKYANNSAVTYLDNATWFRRLTAMPEFKGLVKSIWKKSVSKINKLTDDIDKFAQMISKSQKYNYEYWGINEPAEHTYEFVTEGLHTFEDQVLYLSIFTEERITYMNDKITRW